MGVVFHEITHWADLVSTYWGRSYTQKIFQCHRIAQRVSIEGSEKDFWKFIDLHDDDRRFRLPKYYYTIDNKYGDFDKDDPWAIQFSSGIEFTPDGKPNPQRPIVFFRFIDAAQGAVVVRQPLTPGALLETTAVHSEIVASLEAISALPAGERQVEEMLWNREIENYACGKEYTVYTAPAHTVGYYAEVHDTKQRYAMAARLAHLCLNITPELFNRIRPPAVMHAWRERVPAFKARRNVAFAFAVIAAHAGRLWEGESIHTWLARGLKNSGLPAIEEIFSRARVAIERQVPGEIYTRFGVTEKYLLDIGKIVFEHRVEDCSLSLDRATSERMPLPPMFNDDEELFAIGDVSLDEKKFDALHMYNAEWDLEREMRNFYASCR